MTRVRQADIRHGTPSAYSWRGCHCPECREAWRLYKKRLREGRQLPAYVESWGTAHRLQALVAIGYGWRTLGQHLGRSARMVCSWGYRRDEVVHRHTAEAVRRVYEQLRNVPAPAGYPSARALNTATRNGWHPPAYWDEWGLIDDPDPDPTAVVVDEVAVARVVAGRAPLRSLTNRAEKAAVVAALLRSRDELLRPYTLTRVAYRLGISYDSARRYARLADQPTDDGQQAA